MSKFNYDELHTVYKAFKQSYFEGDETSLLALSKQYDYQDIHCLYQLFERLEDKPSTTSMSLMALGIDWQTQQALFGDFETLREIAGLVSPPPMSHAECFDAFVLPYWTIMSKKGIVLISTRSQEHFTFVHRVSGVEIQVNIKR
ncbi:hypothetical protein AB6C54_23595 [Vibrio splendidus]|uniref:hypothetical protein n=1 Tax=Vibrio splendidus TaxID=29497 RepID=UPI00076AAA2F|nr:hypothetical protein [Vibrio splendidus]PHX03468.1 hypothetical protein VSPL_51100 [Vibrio splendidus]